MDSTRATTSPLGEIPRYEILDLIGEGALASVYKVRTRKDGSIRALKALKPEQAETERAVARFEDEYRILGALHHATLPEVFDYGVSPDGRRFMVMEYLEGVPLDEHVRENPDDLWLLLYQLNEALAFIHEHDLLHFDLKPGNVLVRRTKAFGENEMPLAVLIDFGLSYRRETGGAVKLVGTPGYMAPEVIRGEENLTRAVDYYSLGVIIYELIEGRLPFEGSMHDILRAHLTSEVTFEKQKVEYAELYPWVQKLMSKEPRERLEAFQEFRRAMAARLGETTEKIERVFALGYVESLGLVGKGEAWKELAAWASRVSEGLAERKKGEDGLSGRKGAAPVETVRFVEAESATATDVLKGSATGLEERIKQDLMASAAAAWGRERREEPIRGIPRVIAITGPPQSGKSTILSALKTELRVRGVDVVSLGNESDYKTLIQSSAKGRRGRSEQVDPSSLIVDRFVAGWEELSRMGCGAGVVVVVDDLDRASVEEKEFLEYVGKRLGHELAEGKEPGVFVLAVGRRDDVRSVLLPVAGKEGALSALEVPPPGKEDADAIAERFRGHLSGVTEQRSLSAFLQANLQTSSALHASLKQAVADGGLVHQHGKWHFHDSLVRPLESADTTAAYYQGLFRELTGAARDLVAVLACHPSALWLNDLADISGLSETDIHDAVETIRPYRIVQLTAAGQARRLDIISDQVREGLRLALKKPEQERIHKRTIAHFVQRAEDSARYFEIMSYHHEQLGLTRDALFMRIRALGAARRARDVFALRRLCEGGIQYVRRLKGSEWTARRTLVDRYFIKQWVNAEWMVSNYRNLVSVIEEQFTKRDHEIPLSFLYKYATALERTGKIDACKKVIEEGKRRIGDAKSETYYLLVLEEGSVEYSGGAFKQSLTLLDTIRPEALAAEPRARLFVICVHGYQYLGQEEKWVEYIDKAERLSKEQGLTEQILRVEYSRIRGMLTKGIYGPTMNMIRRGIRLAVVHKAYRGLCSMYFVASALYYELGDYRRTLRFLDRTIRVAKENGIPNWVYEYTIRYAYIYEKLGLYGNAIDSAQNVVRAVNNDPAYYQQHFTALIAVLDNLVMINSRRADDILPELVRAAQNVQARNRVAFYHRALGYYYAKNSDIGRAMEEFEKARHLFSMIKMLDEQAAAEIAIASLLVLQGRLDEANRILAEIGPSVQTMESQEIRGRYFTAELRSRVAARVDEKQIEDCMIRCEMIRPQLADLDVAMSLDAELFEGAVAVGDVRKASAVFHRYYSWVRYVAGNLSSDYVADFVNSPRLTTLVEEYRSLKTQDPGRRCGGRPGSLEGGS